MSNQLQRPKPRPFYCSAYTDSETLSDDTGLFSSGFDFGFWRFYAFPQSAITISASDLRVPPTDWNWNANRCNEPADCQ